ncbi:hypothetical protein [Natronococcus wangiae]|uniref:hypothetical protein n=1 Tax=Natronococcus wangiae TaxID=3068275 RepID=UPI0027402C18|nr:hypothetical protein [Natronococcus sp. AD5]
MSDERSTAAAGPSDQQLRYAAGVVALLVAGLHLFHPQYGLERLVILLSTDPALLVSHPRPIAFVLSAVAIVVGIYLILFGVLVRPIYALGMILVLTYLVGYFAWHLTGHGGFLPGRMPNYHGQGPYETVIAHLRGDLWARAAILLESVLLVLLVVLYRQES